MIWVCKNCHGRIHGVEWRSDHGHLTKVGLLEARAKGRIGGNPGLRAGDAEAIRKITAARSAVREARLIDESAAWLPAVCELRASGSSWNDTARAIGMTGERLRRAVRCLVALGRADAALLKQAPVRCPENRLIPLIKALMPGKTLQQICTYLEAMRERTPRGGTRWHPSSVRHLMLKGGLRQDGAGFEGPEAVPDPAGEAPPVAATGVGSQFL